MERWNDGTIERWNDGTMERWNDGTMEKWEEWKSGKISTYYTEDFNNKENNDFIKNSRE